MAETFDQIKHLQHKFFVLLPFNISAMQCGCQAFHAGKDYFVKYHRTPQFKVWNDQNTVVFLDAGDTNNDEGTDFFGSLNQDLKTLQGIDVPVGIFYEPSLNNALTAVGFIADERVFNRKLYAWEDRTSPRVPTEEEIESIGGFRNLVLRGIVYPKPTRKP